MVFSSPIFLFVFLPFVFIVNKALPVRLRNTFLLFVSLIFYAWGEPIYIVLMLLSVLVNYGMARFIGPMDERSKHAKLFLVFSIIFNIGMLFVFKYANFFTDNVNFLLGSAIEIPLIRLPIGISFFTFQAMSYSIDVYRGQTPPEKNPGNVLLYISFFPQLIAGPIVIYSDIHKQIRKREETLEKTVTGIKRFTVGLGKKILIANSLGSVADQVFALSGSEMNAPIAWLGAITYSLQIYFDFSGYSDMAIGLAGLFGFHLKENFNYPYISGSIKDFWRRWHISLSTWFREYLYIPLGGNRKGMARTAIHLIIVFFCTGIWHGAQWTFVVWGFYHGLFIMLERIGVIRPERWKIKALGNVYTLLVAVTAFVIFRAESIGLGFSMIAKMFTGFSSTPEMQTFLYRTVTPYLILFLLIGIIGATRLPKTLFEKISSQSFIPKELPGYASMLFSIVILGLCILSLSSTAYNPFIYFRF
ncbi:MAG: MBOAT family protein [Clostridiaceae bacterium]|mgnify:CR=1 FL=1|nr:MBOAT family protein [Clostridiaceae bacterium]